MKMDGSVLEEKLYFKMLGLTFSSKVDWGSYIFFIGVLICSMKFLSPEFAFCLNKSTIHPFMEYFCHISAGDPSRYLELLGKLQK